MKIQCDVCEKAEATVLCCADQAALCWHCDEHVHAANKLASKHQRTSLLPISASSQLPNCDICQERAGYVFCLEDRALLCRNCDVGIHTSSPSSHRRFLITGTRVALQHYLTDHTCSSNNDKSNSTDSNGKNSKPSIAPSTSHYSVNDAATQWSWTELFDTTQLEQCITLSEPGSSS